MGKVRFHAYSEIFPLIEGADFDALVLNIEAHGLREKIVLYKGKILDGRNRFLACEKARVKPAYRDFIGNDEDALEFVISANIHRRHLTESQRAMAAARIANLPLGSNQHSAEGVPIGTGSKMLNASVRSTMRARKVIEKGSKDLQRAVDHGDLPVSRAAAVVHLPKSEQLNAAKKKPEPPKAVELAPAPDFDFSNYEPEDDDAYKANIENVMMADDKLTAMREELKQCHREIQGLKASRDHYQSQAREAVRLLKARDREIEKLTKELRKLTMGTAA